VIARITAFLDGIGIPTTATSLTEPTFLPGLTLDRGAIRYDVMRLTYPGDLLHEAGHIALTPAAERPSLTPESPFNLGDDLGAIAWSYAAILHLQLDPAIVFHDGGYRGNSPAFLRNFAEGHYVGVPLLEWMGMTTWGTFPRMGKWLRD